MLTVLGLTALLMSLRMRNPLNQPVGPGLVPAALSAVILAGAMLELVVAWRQYRIAAAEKALSPAGHTVGQALEGGSRWLLCALAFGVGVVVWKVAGFLVGMTVCVMALVFLDKELKPRACVLFTVVLVLALWLLFEQLLDVSLG